MSRFDNRIIRAATIALLAALALSAAALPAAGDPPDPSDPPFMRDLFPPELIMRHQRDIGLTDAQRDAITAALGRTQSAVVEIEWKLMEESRTLAERMQQTPIDEKAALAVAERVMQLEGEVKRAHLGLLIQIRNGLGAEQVERLKVLRRADAPAPWAE